MKTYKCTFIFPCMGVMYHLNLELDAKTYDDRHLTVVCNQIANRLGCEFLYFEELA